MAFDFSKIVEAETKKQEQAEKSSSNLGYKTVYPFAPGRLEFKFIGNEPSGMLYRELVFHEYWADNKKQKVPCLHEMYGLDCPVCEMVHNVQTSLDDKTVWSKYGAKRQGIMFAKLLNFSPDNYFGDTKNSPKSGDIVIFQFPKSVIAEIRNLIVEFGDECNTIFTENTTRNVTLRVTDKNGSFKDYTFTVKNNSTTLCVDDNGNPDDKAFMEFMTNMPNLKDVKFPSEPKDDYLKICNTIAEEMSLKYFGDEGAKNLFKNAAPMGVVNNTSISTPTTTVNDINPSMNQNDLDEINGNKTYGTVDNHMNNTVNTPNSNESVDPRGPRPSCFGDNQYDDKCANCPWDAECV